VVSTAFPPARRRRVRSPKKADQRLDRATTALFRLIVSEADFRDAGRAFLASARSLDRGELVAHAAERLVARLPNASPTEARRAVWCDVRRLFGWCDLADLETRGRA
jgi:hypothetical protein